MKNKKTTYFLLMVALAVWVFVAKRIFSFRETDRSADFHFVQATTVNTPDIAEDLMLGNRDPFLDKPVAVKIENRSDNHEPFVIEVPTQPSVEFKGVVVNGKTLYGIISATSGIDLIRQGDTLDDFTVKYVDADSIVFQNEGFRFPVYRR